MSTIEHLTNVSSEGHSDVARTMALPIAPAVTSLSGASAVSWGAVLAGAAVAAAASMVLLALGTGLGLAAISPWPQRGVQASAFGIASIVWVIVTQLCACALGGYLAGRLRARWADTPVDEVYFRDTAHGLLTWAVATLVTAGLLLFTALGAAGAASQAAATVAAGAMSGRDGASDRLKPEEAGPLGYMVDYVLRRDPGATSTPGAVADTAAGEGGGAQAAEVRRIFVNSLDAATLPAPDVHYLGTLVARRTGMQLGDAEARVTQAFTTLQTRIANAKIAATVAAESARKVAIQAALWLFVALLGGAFVASCTALLGGRERDA